MIIPCLLIDCLGSEGQRSGDGLLEKWLFDEEKNTLLVIEK